VSPTTIPFLDLTTPHIELEHELVSAFRASLLTAAFVGGPEVEHFEREFAEFCSARHCVGVGSGTDALTFALIAAGVQPGDTVVTVPNTFIATTEAISQAGAQPDFVDVDEQTYTMDPRQLRSYLETACIRQSSRSHAVSKRTGRPVTAVVPVHLYGQMADMDPIFEIASDYNLKVIEDACQAHGAEYFSEKEQRWRRAGSVGHAAAFSFYPGKNLGACGEAGAITTGDERIARRCQMLRDHGQSKKYFHDMPGYNGRLDAIQAGFLRIKLRHLTAWNEQRRERARAYRELFAGAGSSVVLPHVPQSSRPVYHLYVVRVRDRERIQQELGAAGIGTGIHYPIPLHLSKAYEGLSFRRGDFPVAERLASEILSLPMFPGLSRDSQQRVVAELATSSAAAISASPVRAAIAKTSRRSQGTIWIDLDNSPHVPFFAPIIEELRQRDYRVMLTARDCFQVRELVDLFGLKCDIIGHHFGKNTFLKLAGLCVRASQLAPAIVRERPDLAVSHGSRSQLIVAASLGIPSLFMGDYEFSTVSALIHPTWLMCPDVVPNSSIQSDPDRVLKYPGIKEDVYVPRFIPDPMLRSKLDLRDDDLVVTVRPPATEAHYYRPESTELFKAFVEFARQQPDVRMVALPRNDRQAAWLRDTWPELFANGMLRIPPVVDGLNLIWYSDLVVSGGGTMNREAAALGVPVYSTFRGKIGAVDQYLSQTGRLVLLESPDDVRERVTLVRRNRPSRPGKRTSATLINIVEQIVGLMHPLAAVSNRKVA
jgi:dTDP-4-amino-4,6-dideoxygalactose transaminase/predicted glycosyltransferase